MSNHRYVQDDPRSWQPPPPLYVPPDRNPLATGGFVVALIGAVLALIPVVGIVAWGISPVGLILSVVGLGAARRGRGVGRGLAIAGIALGAVGLFVCSIYAASFAAVVSTPLAPAAAPASTPAVSTYAAAPSGEFTTGTYEVGTGPGAIRPGRYRTTGPEGGSPCYWARLSSTDGAFGSIYANNIVSGPSTMTVKSSDNAIELTGSCTWVMQ